MKHRRFFRAGAAVALASASGCSVVLGIGDLPSTSNGASDGGHDASPLWPRPDSSFPSNDGSPANDGNAPIDGGSPDTWSPPLPYAASFAFSHVGATGSLSGVVLKSEDVTKRVFPVYGCLAGADVIGSCCYSAADFPSPTPVSAGTVTFFANDTQLDQVGFTVPYGYNSHVAANWDAGSTLKVTAQGSVSQAFASSVIAPDAVSGLSFDSTKPLFHTTTDTTVGWTPSATPGAKMFVGLGWFDAASSSYVHALRCIVDDADGHVDVPASFVARLVAQDAGAGAGYLTLVSRFVTGESTAKNTSVRVIGLNGVQFQPLTFAP